MQSGKTDLRTHVAEYVLFLAVSMLVWSEVDIALFLIFGHRPTVREYLLVTRCYSTCWLLGYLPFPSIWEKLHGKRREIHVDNPYSLPENSPAPVVASEMPNANPVQSEMPPEVLPPVSSEEVFDSI